MKVAVIGLGDISHIHIPILKAMENVELSVVDSNEAKRDLVPEVPFYSSVDELFAADKPDVIHICLPHWLHYPIAVKAAEAGVHVFCEKPLALDTEEAEKFAELERAYPNLRFGLCLQNRNNKSVARLKQIIDSGEYGKVTGVKAIVCWQRSAEYYRAATWRGTMPEAGGGVMINQTIHTLDLMQYFAGTPKTIRGTISQLMEWGVQVEDTATAVIQFENGAHGLFFGTIANSKNCDVEVQVTLENAEFSIRDNALYKNGEETSEEICRDDRLPGVKFYYGASHMTTIHDFYNSLSNNDDKYIHACEGVPSIKMIDAIRKSSDANHAVEY